MKTVLKRFIKSLAYGQKGFTLIELLVVVSILGILSAVAIPSLSGLTARAKINAASSELRTVQMAMDAMMADRAISNVTQAAATADMQIFPRTAQDSGETSLYPNYLRSQSTHGTYGSISNGAVTQVTYP